MALKASFPPLGSRRLLRGGTLAALLVLSGTIVSSCLTPSIRFDEANLGLGGAGGSTSALSDSSTSSTTEDSGRADPLVHCQNGITDENETDLDCGGADCPACEKGSVCEVPRDCSGTSCTEGICRNPECLNNKQDKLETDEDCGGPDCSPCVSGKNCKLDTDCESNICTEGVCAKATCSDEKQNQGEADVDCGGPCEGCNLGNACATLDHCQQPDMGKGAVECEEFRCTINCPDDWADCNGRADDGCEANIGSDTEHCGACNVSCAPQNVEEALCEKGQCSYAGQCDDGFDDCNGVTEDGCEVDLMQDTNNCGACTEQCSTNHGTSSCEGGSCSIECESGYEDCDNDPASNGCEFELATLGSVESCLSCGDTCEGQHPFCDLDEGCKDRLTLAIEGEWTGGAADGEQAQVEINITGEPGTNRALVALVSAASPPTVTLGSVTSFSTLVREKSVTDAEVGFTGIYYLLDADIGDAGARTVSINSGWGGKVITVMELSGVEQVPPTEFGAMQGAHCPVNLTMTAEVSVQGSFIAGALMARMDGAVGAARVGFSTELLKEYRVTQTNAMFGYVKDATSAVQVGWENIGPTCYDTALVTATFRPMVFTP